MEELLKNPDFQKLVPYLIIVFIVQILMWLLFANTIRTTLNLIKEDNRCILPNQAWLVALPLFNIYWNFVVVRRLTDSLNNEFYDRQIAIEEEPTQKQGYMYAGGYMVSNIPLPTFVGFMASIIAFVGFVLYWFKIYEYKKLLREPFEYRGAKDVDGRESEEGYL
ncbi:hypothetical protein [Sphingobacterium faecale]|uniref:DUF4328 domain-containing protein n=1 Tax=Sphingobacterium faecale TaxID=2803775 RepID=A0ABS1R498_9SPHI|nr:hypothetical protein [Sphingobacterium faecale]MBL1409536.1 hypothetical protein [Sphingobacterium faecale]